VRKSKDASPPRSSGRYRTTTQSVAARPLPLEELRATSYGPGATRTPANSQALRAIEAIAPRRKAISVALRLARSSRTEFQSMKPAIIAPEPETEPVTLIGKLIELWRGGGGGKEPKP